MAMRATLVGVLAFPALVAAAEHTCAAGSCGEELGDEVSQLQVRGSSGFGPWRPQGPKCKADIPVGPFLPPWPAGVPHPQDCRYTDSHKCAINGPGSSPGRGKGRALTNEEGWVNVYPDGKTASTSTRTGCLDGSDFYLTVRKSKTTTKKLHIHLQAGGACWDWVSYNTKLGNNTACHHNVQPEPPTGAFNTTNPENPWHDHSFVIINYCSGDAHGGDAEQKWGGVFRKEVKIRGYENTKAGLDYALANFPELETLTFSGSSAGSLGVQLWSEKVLELFGPRTDDVLIIGDSFVGVIYPPDSTLPSESFLYTKWGWCNSYMLNADQVQRCNAGGMQLSDVWSETMQLHKDVRFASVNSKADNVQIAFERALEASRGSADGATMSEGNFYKYMSLTIKDWFKLPNYFQYMVQAAQHTYLPLAMDTAAPGDADGDSTRPRMIEWLAKLLDPEEWKTAPRTVCSGEPMVLDPSTHVHRGEFDYCASALAYVEDA